MQNQPAVIQRTTLASAVRIARAMGYTCEPCTIERVNVLGQQLWTMIFKGVNV